ncbi:MAG: TonB-dependent receptor, partial [Ignavibacteria bacterium]|nr:TonB-dependent receptor [Ignavibacteria bacterium]
LHRESRFLTLKADLVSQITQEHQIKAGGEAKLHRIWIHNFGIRNDQSTGFVPTPVEFGRSEFAHTTIKPRQYAAYIQDKMEFNDFIVNLGVRFDYFNSRANILVEQLRLGQTAAFERAEPEGQLSPRIGISYPITDRGVLHVSYGHFFQVPQFDLMFLNPGYNINATDAFQVGNPGLRSQRTVAYELGLQQQLSPDIRLDVTGFYKDFRNLIGTEIFDIGNGNKYSQFVNRDYGNARGIILSLEKRFAGGFSATLDYTFQIAQGNASDPNAVFLDNETDPPRASQKQLAPLDWDRRHSVNVTTTIGALENYTITAIGRIGTGLPYTPAFQNQRTGLLNSENRPLVATLDIYATKYLHVFGSPLNVFVKVYNVFDTRNELDVFSDTGRAGYSVEANYSGAPRGVNTTEEFYTRPEFYSAPRQIVLGMGVSF